MDNLIFVNVLAFALVLSVLGASALFFMLKNGWDEYYQLHRKSWMPYWCQPCATMWVVIPFAAAWVLYTKEWHLFLSIPMVPVLATIIFKKFRGDN